MSGVAEDFMVEVELMRAGTDAQGNTVTQKSLEAVVAAFKPGSISVTVGFGPGGPQVGKVQALRLEKDRIMATVELDDVSVGMVTVEMGPASVGQKERW